MFMLMWIVMTFLALLTWMIVFVECFLIDKNERDFFTEVMLLVTFIMCFVPLVSLIGMLVSIILHTEYCRKS